MDPYQFVPSKTPCSTEDIIHKRDGTSRARWIRGVRVNLVKPRLIEDDKPFRSSELYLVEFSDEGIYSSFLNMWIYFII